MSLGWGLLSTARINDALLGAHAARFVAVASRDEERARAYAQARGIPRAHGSYAALLADPEVEAVYVPLPNALHVPWAVRALEAGKHVLCEKPLGRRAADVERAFAVAEERGLVLAEAFMWRHHPQVERALALLADGAIGPLRTLHAVFAIGTREQGDVRLSGDLEGGALMDVGCYCVSGARALAGTDPERVTAQQVRGGEGVDVALVATLRFPDDVLATIECGMRTASRSELAAIGEHGVLRLTDPWHAFRPVLELSHGGDTEIIEIQPANAYALELQDFEAAVGGRHAPLLGRDDALGQARTIEALYAAAERGEAVDVG